MAAICTQCSVGDEIVEFPDMLELKKHEMLGHESRWEKPLPVDPRGDHPSATELKEQKQKKPTSPQVDKPTSEEAIMPLIPLELKYQWTGQCPTCRDNAKTIEIEMSDHSVVVAYCVRDDKKLQQRRAVPISSQASRFVVDKTFENNIKRK